MAVKKTAKRSPSGERFPLLSRVCRDQCDDVMVNIERVHLISRIGIIHPDASVEPCDGRPGRGGVLNGVDLRDAVGRHKEVLFILRRRSWDDDHKQWLTVEKHLHGRDVSALAVSDIYVGLDPAVAKLGHRRVDACHRPVDVLACDDVRVLPLWEIVVGCVVHKQKPPFTP